MALSIDLSERVFLVCGIARGGIGGATARQIAAAGGAVVGVDLSREVLDPTIADIEQAGGRCDGIVADVTDPAQTDPLIANIIKRHGRLDGVANVAGGTKEHEWMPLERTPTQQFRETMNLNLEYVFRICRDAAASMISRKVPGSLVNVGSVSSLTSAPWHGPYGAAKSGIAALTRTMAFEWKPYGIRANTVQPGAVMTERVRARIPPANVDKSSTVDFTSVEQLANTITFLLSDLASGISGQTLSVDSALSTKFCGGARKAVASENP